MQEINMDINLGRQAEAWQRGNWDGSRQVGGASASRDLFIAPNVAGDRLARRMLTRGVVMTL